LKSVRESENVSDAVPVADSVVVLEAVPLVERVSESADVADAVCVRMLCVTDAESEVVAVAESDRERSQDMERDSVPRETVAEIVFVGVGPEWVRLSSPENDCDSESCCDWVSVDVGVDVKDPDSSRVGVGTRDDDGESVADTVDDLTGAVADAETFDSDMVKILEPEKLPVGDGVSISDAVVDRSLDGLDVRELVRWDVGVMDPDGLTLRVNRPDSVLELVPLGSPDVTVRLRLAESVAVDIDEGVGLGDAIVRDALRERPPVAEAEMEKRES
jgi:hypothetical protein